MNTHAHMRPRTHTVIHQGNETEEKIFKKRKVFEEDLKELRGRTMDRNKELVSGNWSLVRERALTSGLCLVVQCKHSPIVQCKHSPRPVQEILNCETFLE